MIQFQKDPNLKHLCLLMSGLSIDDASKKDSDYFLNMPELDSLSENEINQILADAAYYNYIKSEAYWIDDKHVLDVYGIGINGFYLAHAMRDTTARTLIGIWLKNNPNSNIVEFSDYVKTISPLNKK